VVVTIPLMITTASLRNARELMVVQTALLSVKHFGKLACVMLVSTGHKNYVQLQVKQVAKVLRRVADAAGGSISQGSSNVLIVDSDGSNSYGVARNGDAVTGHGSGIHAGPVMVASTQTNVKCDGITVCVVGDLASCGHAGGAGADTVQIM
jgi:uncharacterized Zn-binding protein involved in type VI secretion